ncbi:hypothetical protein HOY80DRAFT_1043405 [Tuber brumale]|nr:hypothetical protein HOY80DRAFT_1043405 [Tuber brumale]
MRPEVSSRRDTFGLIAIPWKSKDIRRQVQVAESLLDTGMASLSLKDDVQTMDQIMIIQVKTIMRELGHQLETEIAQQELYQEQSKKLQGIVPIYNKTDRRKLTEARIITGADLMRLHDIRLEKDIKPQSSTKVDTSLPEEVQSNHSSELSESDWISSPESEVPPTTIPLQPRTSKQKTTNILPDRPLHMLLRSRKP